MSEVSCYRSGGDAACVDHYRCSKLNNKDADVERFGRHFNVDNELRSDESVRVFEQHQTQTTSSLTMRGLFRRFSLFVLLIALTLHADASSINSPRRKTASVADHLMKTLPPRQGYGRFTTSTTFQTDELPLVDRNSARPSAVNNDSPRRVPMTERVRPSNAINGVKLVDDIVERSNDLLQSSTHSPLDLYSTRGSTFNGLQQQQSIYDGQQQPKMLQSTLRQLVDGYRRAGRKRRSLFDEDNDGVLAIATRSGFAGESAGRFGSHTAVGAAWDAYERILRQKYDELDSSAFDEGEHYYSGRLKNPVRFIG